MSFKDIQECYWSEMDEVDQAEEEGEISPTLAETYRRNLTHNYNQDLEEFQRAQKGELT